MLFTILGLGVATAINASGASPLFFPALGLLGVAIDRERARK